MDRVIKANNAVYNAYYIYSQKTIMSGQDDSVSNFKGECWFVKDSSDKLFNARFHTKFIATNMNTEFYYDGQKSYEINHDNKTITITNPFEFELNFHNPSKTRMASMPLRDEYIVSNFIQNQFSKNIVGVWINEDDKFYALRSLSKDTVFGECEYEIKVDKKTFLINEFLIKWNSFGNIMLNKISVSFVSINQKNVEQKTRFIKSSFPSYQSINYKDPSLSQNTVVKKYNKGSVIDTVYLKKVLGIQGVNKNYLLLDFWEVWCGPCITAFPKVNNLKEKYKSKNLEIFGVTTGLKSKVQKIIDDGKIKYRNRIVDKSVHNELEVRGFPTYILVSPDGKIIEYSEGDIDPIEASLTKIFNQ
ncbi:MAG: TlpA disulfide reductase family protein [Bacteroidota bacterium]|nr:TlpA disulfide reductase family protein [Bacteroidota bacterium]